MAAVDDILQSLPIDQLAQQVGADPQEVQQAAQAALPALLGGLQANAQDPGGASSIVEALGQHDDDLLRGGVNLGQVDESDGQRIASHIFGSNEEQVYSALGSSSGASGGLVRRLIPILAPIVLSYLANRVLKGGGGGLGGGLGGGGLGGGLGGGGLGGPTTGTTGPMDNSAQGGPGSLDSMLRDVLGGALGGSATSQTQPPQQPQAPQAPTGRAQQPGGSILDVLGGLLGGGRR